MISATMPLETLFSNPLPSVPRSRSIISRFTSPLSSRTRNVDIDIEPEQPWKTYFPGEIVKGQVVLTVLKGFDITHLVTCLHGRARVYRTHIVPGEAAPVNEVSDIGKGPRGVEFHGHGLVTLFQDEIVLCRGGFLKKGVYKFGFELEFPGRGLPSSIEVRAQTISHCYNE